MRQNAHAQDYAANDELQLPILKAFAQYNSQYTLLEMLDVCSVCVCVCVCVVTEQVCCSYQYQCSSPHCSQQTPRRARHARPPSDIISWSVVCRLRYACQI